MARPRSTPGGQDLLTTIRDRTAGLHRELERVSRLAVPAPELPDYGRFLRAMRSFLEVVEPVLEGYPAWVPFEPSLADRLGRDLRDLSGQGPEPGPGQNPGRPPEGDAEGRATPPSSAAEAWGVAYVLEGSRLGGTVLARILRAQHGDVPTGYLHSEEDEGRWASFRHRLREQGPDPSDPAETGASDRVAEAAARAFREIAALLAPAAGDDPRVTAGEPNER